MKKLLKNSQFALFLLLVATVIIFGIINPDILSAASLFALARTCAVPAIFALAIMVIMILGELDMSFCMIGAFAAYATMYFLTSKGYMEVPLILIFAMSILIGVILQLFNWVLIDRLKMKSFIATLGTQTLPNSAVKFGSTYMATAKYGSGVESQLPSAILLTLAMYFILHMVLEHTNFGRKLYAIGGDADAAKRAGIAVSRTRFWAFIIVGIICGTGGVIHNCLGRCSLPMPTDLVGQELNGMAAVVLGRGASMRARGTVIGTFLGVLLLQFISNNLIMIGVPSYYQDFVTGVIVFLGLVSQSRQRNGGSNKKEKKEAMA